MLTSRFHLGYKWIIYVTFFSTAFFIESRIMGVIRKDDSKRTWKKAVWPILRYPSRIWKRSWLFEIDSGCVQRHLFPALVMERRMVKWFWMMIIKKMEGNCWDMFQALSQNPSGATKIYSVSRPRLELENLEYGGGVWPLHSDYLSGSLEWRRKPLTFRLGLEPDMSTVWCGCVNPAAAAAAIIRVSCSWIIRQTTNWEGILLTMGHCAVENRREGVSLWLARRLEAPYLASPSQLEVAEITRT